MPDTTEGDAPVTPTWQALYEIKAALSAIQTTGNFVKEEQAAVRDRLHDLSNQLTPLMGLPEQMREMKRDHEELRRRLDTMTMIGERVTKLEPTVKELETMKNRGMGALAAAGVIGAGVVEFVRWVISGK